MIPLFVLNWDGDGVHALGDDLQAPGAGLVLRRGPAAATVRKLSREIGARAMPWNRCPETVAGDATLEPALASDGVDVSIFNAFVLMEAGTVLTGAGSFLPRLHALLEAPARALLAATGLVRDNRDQTA